MAKKRVITGKVEASPEISLDHKAELLPPSPFSGYQLPADKTWKPGASANPGGAPKGKRLTTWLAEFGNMNPKDWPTDDQLADLPAFAGIAIAQLRRAQDQADGLPAAMWAADRIEGGVDRTVHLTHKQEPTMSVEEARKMLDATDPAKKLEEF